MFCESDSQRVIRIPTTPEAEAFSNSELRYDPRSAADLLGFLLLQAISDGMSKIVLGVDGDSKAYMKHARPAASGVFESWDMIAPPAELFPYLLQHVFSITELEPMLPARGKALARQGKKLIELQVSFSTLSNIEITWDATLSA